MDYSRITFTIQDLIKEWDTDHVQTNYDPTAILHKMADILEKETNVYMASDPGDTFDKTRKIGLHLRKL